MRVIVGLGNPGRTYQHTRHNLGWMVLEQAAHRWGIALTLQSQAIQGQGAFDAHPVLLAMPLKWMNLSGEAVSSMLRENQLNSSDLILVYDDLDLPLGQLKIKIRGGAGGHNGVRSVLDCLGTDNFCRVKLGIGKPPSHEDVVNYVLSPFTEDEQAEVNALLPHVVDALECVLTEGIPAAMNKFHVRPDHDKKA